MEFYLHSPIRPHGMGLKINTGTPLPYLKLIFCENLHQSHSFGQEIPELQIPKVYYHHHKSKPVDSILSQFNPLHTCTPHLFMVCFSVSFSYTPNLSNGLFLSGFPNKFFYVIFISHAVCLAHLILDYMALTTSAEKYKL
jgi:hypothetical protein